jgi:polyphenol oxidase
MILVGFAMVPSAPIRPARKGTGRAPPAALRGPDRLRCAGPGRVYCGGVDAATRATARTAGGPPDGQPSRARLGTRAGLDVLTWPALDEAGLDVIVTTRHGGVSSGPYTSLNLGLHVGDEPGLVLENRRRAAAVLGAAPGDVVWAAQPHGRVATVVTAADRGRGAFTGPETDPSAAPGAGSGGGPGGPGGRPAGPDADALVTAEPGPVLAILVADCVPIVLHDPVARVLAVVHAGWRGTVARVTDAALAAMTSLGATARDVRAGIGPAVGPGRYQVGDDVAGPARETLGGDAGRVLRPDGTGRWRLDLPAANALLLTAAGVPAGQIYLAAERTGGSGPFFSHRDQRPGGRFALLARLQPGRPQ